MSTESAQPIPVYRPIDVVAVTPRTSPPYALMTFVQRNSRYVLAKDGSDKLLVGPLGVNYFVDGKPSSEGIYLRRWDVPPFRGPKPKPKKSRSGNGSRKNGG